jgi:hypothetical protein
MRKAILFGALLALVGTSVFAPAALAEPKVKFHAEVTTRLEHIENFTDFRETEDGAFQDRVNFGFYRARIGAHADVGDGVSAFISLQNHGTWGDTFPVPSNPQDPMIGGLWLTSIIGSNTVSLYEAWVKWENIGDSAFSAKLGRQEHVLGNELHMGDNDFYSGQYFDGLRMMLDYDAWDLEAFYYWIQERDVLPGSLGALDEGIVANGGSDDQTLWGFSADFEIADGHDIEPYILVHRQDNEVDLLLPKFNIITYGLLYERPTEHDSPFDWSVELAGQSGDVGTGADEVDQSGYAFEGWFGYTFGDEDASHHRFHIGALMLSDSDDAEDLKSFIPLFPDTHRRAGMADIFSLLSSSFANVAGVSSGTQPLSTFHNLQDIHVGWNWANGRASHVGAAYHMFTLSEDDFTDSAGFQFESDDVGDEFDVYYKYMHGEHLGLMVGLGYFMPGDHFKKDIAEEFDEAVPRLFAQAKFRM